MDQINITIVGAGIIGLAIAAELSKKYTDILILEKNVSFGQEISSRNSEVIHAGIYYPKDSLKLKLCLEGSRYLYEICKKNYIPYNPLGKLIIATDVSELNELEGLYTHALANGLTEIELYDKNRIQKIEPNVHALAGIYSPKTGIIDSHSLMKYFVGIAKNNGVEIAYNCEVNFLFKESQGFLVGVKDDQFRFRSNWVINSAGLSADKIASFIGLDVQKLGYALHFCKGDYFFYTKPSPVTRLIYPLPSENCLGLGIHATLDLGSRLKFGPDHEYVQEIDYRVNPKKADKFYYSACKMIKDLDKASIIPDMAGIRPKLQGPHETFKDFVIKNEADIGLNGFINLIGIESPGLTSCIAIAKMVSTLLE